MVLDAFRHVATISFAVPVRSSVCQHISAKFPQDRSSRNFTLGTFTKICRGTPNLLEIVKNMGQFARKPNSVSYCSSDVRSATVQRKHCHAYIAKVSIFTGLHSWQWHARQKYKGNALLHLHVNNGYTNAPQCYFICSLPTLSKYEIKQLKGQIIETFPKEGERKILNNNI